MHPSRATVAVLVALALLVGACVPQPATRTSPPTATATPSLDPSESPAPTGPSAPPSFVRPTPTALPTFLAYTVVAGDTLSSIARRFATTALTIAYWNRGRYPSLDPDSDAYAPDRIKVGWILDVIPGVAIDGSDLPETSSPPATGGPGPAPSTPSSGSSTAPTVAPSIAGVSTVIRHGPRTSDTVALTFDMGGRLDPATDILGWLVDHDVPATIFPTGKTGTTTEQGRAALEIVAEHRDQFGLGNHSWSHPDFRDLDAPAIRDQLERTDAAVTALIARSTKPWFRPPYGGLDDQIPAVVGAAGWGYTVLWEVDTIDWRPESDGGPTAADIVAKVVGSAKAGSIVLMHLGGYYTLEALPGIVSGLHARGLTPVTLGTMFGR